MRWECKERCLCLPDAPVQSTHSAVTKTVSIAASSYHSESWVTLWSQVCVSQVCVSQVCLSGMSLSVWVSQVCVRPDTLYCYCSSRWAALNQHEPTGEGHWKVSTERQRDLINIHEPRLHAAFFKSLTPSESELDFFIHLIFALLQYRDE